MKKTVADYLAMGMDEKTARYFADGRRRIVSAKPSQGYTILLSFDNGEHRVLDCSAKFTEGVGVQQVVRAGGVQPCFCR